MNPALAPKKRTLSEKEDTRRAFHDIGNKPTRKKRAPEPRQRIVSLRNVTRERGNHQLESPPAYRASKIRDAGAFFRDLDISNRVSPIRSHSSSSVLFIEQKRKPKLKRRLHRGKVRDTYTLNIMDPEYLEINIEYLLTKDDKYVLPDDFLLHYNPDSNLRRETLAWILKNEVLLSIEREQNYFRIVRLFDFVLAYKHVPTNMYQLVTMTLCWIVSKMFDKHLSIANLEFICHNRYSGLDFKKMERKLLHFFQFDININEPTSFISYYAFKLDLDIDHEVTMFAKELLESFSTDAIFSTYSASKLATMSLSLAARIIHMQIDGNVFGFNKIYSSPEMHTMLKKSVMSR